MSTDTSLRLENMIVTSHKLNPDGSESMSLQQVAPQQVNDWLDKCKQILEKNEGKIMVIDSVPTQLRAEPEVKECDSVSVKIFIAGDYNQARKVINDYCFRNGLCVNVVKTTYIYSAGEEHGVAVELINYPRFPKLASEIEETALKLALELRQQLNQDSFSIQTIPGKTRFFSWRHLRGK